MKIFFKGTLTMVLLAMVLSVVACKKDEAPLATKNFELYLNYWNPSGSDPQVEFDQAQTSPEIIIDFSKEFGSELVPPNLVTVNIDNMRILDENSLNYEIAEIEAYELKENTWKQDVEFTMDFVPTQDLAVYLVLDASKSLGDDFDDVKQYAQSFVNQIFENVPNARIGVITFSDEVRIKELGTNRTDILNYIDSTPTGDYTALYSAMDLAITKLKAATAESKAILTFTDGEDNNSPLSLNPAYLRDQVMNDSTNAKIVTYNIGLKGANRTIDEEALEYLSLNGGKAEFPNSVQELGEAFKNFSQSISTVYTLQYTRNRQQVLEQSKRQLKFLIKAKRK